MRKFISSEPTLIFHLFLIIFGKIFGWIFSPKNAPKAAFSLGKNALDWFLTDSTNFTRFLGVFGGEKRLFQSFYTFFFSLGEKNVAKSESRAPIAVWYSGVFEKSVVTRPRATNHRAPFRCGNFYQAREKKRDSQSGPDIRVGAACRGDRAPGGTNHSSKKTIYAFTNNRTTFCLKAWNCQKRPFLKFWDFVRFILSEQK